MGDVAVDKATMFWEDVKGTQEGPGRSKALQIFREFILDVANLKSTNANYSLLGGIVREIPASAMSSNLNSVEGWHIFRKTCHSLTTAVVKKTPE